MALPKRRIRRRIFMACRGFLSISLSWQDNSVTLPMLARGVSKTLNASAKARPLPTILRLWLFASRALVHRLTHPEWVFKRLLNSLLSLYRHYRASGNPAVACFQDSGSHRFGRNDDSDSESLWHHTSVQ